MLGLSRTFFREPPTKSNGVGRGMGKQRNWRQSAADRRDIKASKPEDTATPSAPSSKKKDTRRWCRGKEGVEHIKVVASYNEMKGLQNTPLTGIFTDWLILMCSSCGKELATYFPFRRYGQGQKVPERTEKIPEWVLSHIKTKTST